MGQRRETITSVSNPRVKAVVRLRRGRGRRESGRFIAEGRREVSRALAAGLRLEEAFVCRSMLGKPGVDGLGGWLDGATWVSGEVLGKMAYHRKPEGVLAVFEAPRWDPASLSRGTPAVGGADAGEEVPGKKLPGAGLVLVLVGTEKPGNLGAMVRTASAAGCRAVLAVGPVVDAMNPNAIRNSTGAVFSMPILEFDAAGEALGWLQDGGYRVAAAVVGDGEDCYAADLTAARLAIVVGPEHAGLGAAWSDAADVRVSIPTAGGGGGTSAVDSLNASNAAAVLLFEAVRQRAGV